MAVDRYFEWLCRKVHIMHNKMRYFRMAEYLHETPYKPGDIETDSNRAFDGLQLRVQFMAKHGPLGSSTNRGPCTMLEFLIALAKRMSFLTENDESPHRTASFFWAMIRNLDIYKLSDEQYEYLDGDFRMQDAVDRLLLRTYEWNGKGGLFPLKHCHRDQRKVEVWYQMQAWLEENEGGEL